MPALEHLLSDGLPEQLYTDTDFLVSALVGAEPHHATVSAFLERLISNGSCTLYLSSLSWLEYGSVIVREQFRAGLPADVARALRLGRWQHPLVRQAYVRHHLAALQALLDQFY